MPRFNGTGNSDLQDVRPISLTTQELSKAAVKARQRDKHPKYTHAVIAGQVSETGSMVFNIVHHTLHVCMYIYIYVYFWRCPKIGLLPELLLNSNSSKVGAF